MLAEALVMAELITGGSFGSFEVAPRDDVLLRLKKVQDRHLSMSWSHIKGIGNVIRHAYDGIDAQVIWATMTSQALASLAND